MQLVNTSTQQQQQQQVKRRGRKRSPGLRGKKAPSSDNLESLGRMEGKQELPQRTTSTGSSSPGGTNAAGTAAPTRRRVPSKVNLAALLDSATEASFHASMRAEPQELSLSSHHRRSSKVSVESCRRRSSASISVGLSLDDWHDSIDSAHLSVASFESDGEEEVEVQVVPTRAKSIRMSIIDGNRRKSVRRTFEDMASSASQLTKDDATYEMEVYPGHFVPFRNANEVWKAVGRGHGHTLEYTCLECEAQLVSVVDCEHVVCPDCQMVNPVFEWPAGIQPYGAGMGLKQEWIDEEASSARATVATMTPNAA